MITQSGWLLSAQFLVFAIGAVAGLRYTPFLFIQRLFNQWTRPSTQRVVGPDREVYQ